MADKREGPQANPGAHDNRDMIELLDKLTLLGFPVERGNHFNKLPFEIQLRYCVKTAIKTQEKKYNVNLNLPFDIYDIIPLGSYPEGVRKTHPYHPSSTGLNFMVNTGGKTWRCWKHGVTGGALHLWGISKGIISCVDVGSVSHEEWCEIFRTAREAGLIP